MKASQFRNLSQKLKQIPQKNGAYGLAQPDFLYHPRLPIQG